MFTKGNDNMKRNTKVITMAANKGGTGKSETVLQFNGYVHMMNPNARTLLIDTDQQGDTSLEFTNDDNKQAVANSAIYRAYEHDAHNVQSQFPSDFKPAYVGNGTYLLSGTSGLANVGKMMQANNPAFGLFVIYHALRGLDLLNGQFDFILIDTHNSLSLLPSLGALMVSDSVIVPINPSLFGLHAVSDLLNSVDKLKQKCVNPANGQTYLDFNLYFIGNLLKSGTNSSKEFIKFSQQNKDFIGSFFNREIFQRSVNDKMDIFKLLEYEKQHKSNRYYNDKHLIETKLTPMYKKIYDMVK